MMVKLATTTIGSLPKPDYLQIPGWIKHGVEVENFIEKYNDVMSAEHTEEIEKQMKRATKEIMDMQKKAGLTTLTDGELRRDKYVNGFCRKLNGFDFINTEKKIWRNGAREGLLPRIVSKVSHKNHVGFTANEWRWSQEISDAPVKVTIPGPMTIMDTFVDDFYKDEQVLLQDLATCINIELKEVAEAGCKQVQVCFENG